MSEECSEYIKKITVLERQIKLLGESRKQEERLRTQLNQTMDALKEKKQQLRELNEHLEERVKERTHELNESMHQLTLLASTDHLTKVTNRMKFSILLEQKIKEHKRTQLPISLVFFDLDYFKKVNDTYGHIVGDEVLIAFTQAVTEHIRGEDIFSRWGGEEFIALFNNCDGLGALQRSERLRKIIEQTFHPIAKQITCSIGVTEIRDTDTNDTVILRVDQALYQAKEEGRNRVVLL
ncbi:MAG: GGDEF domain-containing protein [Sulfuricurvum sp.]|uniref:GGDEF domain-containing protein n=1 Tax=Sulfuricurvum sp. TaxID=2025608 RepID=UPI002601BC78|nr:GGDEF domain-containing protein [Sulfuricurvum sp.]MDD2369773.1 GGDEF domain-containing protein [Sulfuricurvum sp.]MDD5118551.1 GGDEF domain-containing protein [Sulfuricurvum sp.]